MMELNDIRIGHGYDVHRYCEGRDLILGGVKIPYEMGLLGHSDADVLLHAIMDAILGAMALGDIGRHFPDTDQKYKNIASTELLCEVVKKMRNNGYSVSNVDATVVLEKPKVMPYIQDMVSNISSILGVDASDVNVKATTEEHLGFTGREEGISAHAVVLLEKNKG
jgi:2-C-methyl-D-erythritol 2,4-cyclodiphosphate synthase